MKRISLMVHCSIRSITIRRGKSTKAMKKAKKTRVIPGYHLTFGIVITLLSLIVLIPLASVLVYALKLSPGEWFRLIMKENVRNAFLTSVGCSFLAAVLNTMDTCQIGVSGEEAVRWIHRAAVCASDCGCRYHAFKAFYGQWILREDIREAWNPDRLYEGRTCDCSDLCRNPVCCAGGTAGIREDGWTV